MEDCQNERVLCYSSKTICVNWLKFSLGFIAINYKQKLNIAFGREYDVYKNELKFWKAKYLICIYNYIFCTLYKGNICINIYTVINKVIALGTEYVVYKLRFWILKYFICFNNYIVCILYMGNILINIYTVMKIKHSHQYKFNEVSKIHAILKLCPLSRKAQLKY